MPRFLFCLGTCSYWICNAFKLLQLKNITKDLPIYIIKRCDGLCWMTLIIYFKSNISTWMLQNYNICIYTHGYILGIKVIIKFFKSHIFSYLFRCICLWEFTCTIVLVEIRWQLVESTLFAPKHTVIYSI